jgi:hypothetical protein
VVQGRFRAAAKVVEEAELSVPLQAYEALVTVHHVSRTHDAVGPLPVSSTMADIL